MQWRLNQIRGVEDDRILSDLGSSIFPSELTERRESKRNASQQPLIEELLLAVPELHLTSNLRLGMVHLGGFGMF